MYFYYYSANNSRSATPTPSATGSTQSSAVQNAVASAGTSGQPSAKRPRFDPTPRYNLDYFMCYIIN